MSLWFDRFTLTKEKTIKNGKKVKRREKGLNNISEVSDDGRINKRVM